MVGHELPIAEPIVELRAFRDFNLTVGCVYSFIMEVDIDTVRYLVLEHLATLKGLNSLPTGEY